ncbi:MAG: thiamine pyrophosphate-binding protein [Chloroflexota bacterium]
MAEEEKMLVDKLRPTAETALRGPAKVDVKAEERVNIGWAVAQMLKQEGVEYLAFLTGGGTSNYIVEIQKAKIKCVHCRNEATAGFFMDAWGRYTTRPGFGLPGAGTGGTNFGTGLCQAYSAGAPGVTLVCESGPFDDDKYGGQGIFRAEHQYNGMAKFVRKVTNPNTLLWQLKRAFRTAMTPPYGPCVVASSNVELNSQLNYMVPRRVLYQTLRPTPAWAPQDFTLETSPDPALVEKAVKWLLEAEKPVIIAGHVAHQEHCQDEYRELAHLLGVPSSARRIARGMISEEDDLNYGRRARGAVFDQADRCIVLGLRIGSLEGWGNPPFFPHTMRYVQIHSHPDYTELNLPTDIEILGNTKKTLQMMIQVVKDMGIKKPIAKWEKWRQFVKDTEESYKKRTIARTDRMAHMMPLHPDYLGRVTAEVLSEDYNNDYIIIIDGYTASAYTTAWNVAVNTGQVMDASETIGIGHSPGMALAAGLSTNRNKLVVGLMGDGALGAHGMDIETNVRWDIPAVFIHHNNNTLINGAWEYFNSKACAVEGNILHDSWETMPWVRHEKMFAEMGCHPEFIERPEQAKEALKRACQFAMKNKRPSFVECFVDMEILHSNYAQPASVLRFAGQIKWDELPDKGQKLIATQLVTPGVMPRLPKDWQEGIAAYQKK